MILYKNGTNFHNNKFPSIEDIQNARDLLIKNNIKKTPLQKSTTFSEITGSNIFMKIESLQKTGTFKVRGALYKINKISQEKIKNYNGIIAASAGNHAQGVAYAAWTKNIPCVIVMPKNASLSKIAATKSYGAKVILEGSDYDESFRIAQQIAKDEKLELISAYDDYDIIIGQGTIGLEIIEELPEVDEIYIPIGGGGLAAGIAIAIKSKNPNVKIIGVESEAYPAMKRSVEMGSLQVVKAGYTIADGISIKSPGNITFEIIKEFIDDIVLVDDSTIVKTMFLLMERAKLVIEPAGAASLAYLLSKSHDIDDYKIRTSISDKKKNVVVVLSGGNIDMYLLGQIVAKGLMQTGRLSKIFLLLQDRPGEFKNVLDSISDLGINIVEVVHDRLSSDIPTGMAGVFLSLEMENQSYIDTLTSRLTEKGIIFKI
ncbi:MAG: threonine ammonia-lyase [Nitrososphaeraceae archaeon]|jgi:threonine dehydratase|nr:threonine ammonia-lyase [Nitrososphaeraceae archaeon]MDW3603608.1 threonine ammonia-lyase [Nitrososphaeraceae archaeon]MDW3611947.1 threonine ammonia-lyase [Nitrososphaeraceae archaeon]